MVFLNSIDTLGPCTLETYVSLETRASCLALFTNYLVAFVIQEASSLFPLRSMLFIILHNVMVWCGDQGQ